jgi:uncharacterized protein YjiS (DUF1127 family)
MPTQSARQVKQWPARSFSVRFAAQCLAMVKEIRARRAMRQSLGNISDRQLRDAGLIRHDLEAACALILRHAAGSDLETARRRRAGNW